MFKAFATYFVLFYVVSMTLIAIYHSSRKQKINFLKISCWGGLSGIIAAVILTTIVVLF
jgi:hypothetical protein